MAHHLQTALAITDRATSHQPAVAAPQPPIRDEPAGHLRCTLQHGQCSMLSAVAWMMMQSHAMLNTLQPPCRKLRRCLCVSVMQHAPVASRGSIAPELQHRSQQRPGVAIRPGHRRPACARPAGGGATAWPQPTRSDISAARLQPWPRGGCWHALITGSSCGRLCTHSSTAGHLQIHLAGNTWHACCNNYLHTRHTAEHTQCDV